MVDSDRNNGFERLTAEQMDEQRVQNVAYQYLCRLEEAKRWIEACLGEELPAPTELEEVLRNGVILAKLGHRFAPNAVGLKKIFDPEQQRYQIQDLYGKVNFTEEEINNMKLELDKYGIHLPAFNKIGGILAKELSVDEAAVHAAVIAINEAVDRGHLEITAASLRNPNALLSDLQEAQMSVYQEMLRQAKAKKKQHAAIKVHSETLGAHEDKDIYEEFLTWREIQDTITLVNIRAAVEQVDEALDSSNQPDLLTALQLSSLALRGLRRDNGPWYLDQLLADRQLKALFSVCISKFAFVCVPTVHTAVQNLNASLRLDDARRTVSCLMVAELQLPEVFPFAATLYHDELKVLQRRAPQGEMQQEELFVAVEMLSEVALINQALEVGQLHQFGSLLTSPSAGLSDVDPTLFHSTHVQIKSGTLQQALFHTCTKSVNAGMGELLAVAEINEAVDRGDSRKLLASLLLPSCGIDEVSAANACRYLTLLTRYRQRKAQVSRDGAAELWLADIQEAVKEANQESQNTLKMCLAVAAVNQAVKENKVSQTLRVLTMPETQLQGIISACAADYQRELYSLITDRIHAGATHVPWVRACLNDGSFYYFHLNKLEGCWEKPKGFIQNSMFLQQHQIQEVVSSVSGLYSRRGLWRGSQALVVRLQALSRGFLLRQQLQARRRYLMVHTPAVILIQAHWRRVVQQRKYRRRLQFLYMNWRAVVKIQSYVKMWLAMKSYRARLNFFRENVGAVVKIQAFFRASKAREEYRMLVHSGTPPLAVVRKFIHLLDLGDGDIREEAELLRLRKEVVQSIRFNRQLEEDLNLMDLKIGLLVRNKATLQEVVTHCKKLTKKNKEQLSGMLDMERSKGLKALSKERRQRLEAYQHLFYLLQTQPLYLAQLIFLMPQTRSTAFMEMLVFSLFNYGSDGRDAFLLLQLFTEALRYEISLKVEKPQDVITGNPTVIKMLVNFYRNAHGQNALRDSLGPALQDILMDKDLSIRTDPVDVYKTWINLSETQTGCKSSLPYDVSPAEALTHPEVQRRVEVAVVNLRNLTDRVLKAITSNLSKLPYGLRYTAKVLRDSLQLKFPGASEDELYKVVGNLVYYRYMNPAIVAPDGFDVVDRSASSTLQPEQRFILGSISRMLQQAAANKHFHGDGPHIRALNQYISQTHSRFRKFLVCVCDVPEPKDRFNVDEFSELLVVNKPVIYISVSELLNTHKALCADPSDPLRLLLQDLGCVPTLQELMGESSADPGSEVSLTLTNRFNIFDETDQVYTGGLLLSTKQLIIDVIRTQSGDSLSDILRASVSHDEKVCHDWLMQRRAQREALTPEKIKRNPTLIANSSLSLEEKKRKILKSLCRLEALGVLKPPHSENQILHMIAKDICQRRLHRQCRGAELQKLGQTLCSLEAKACFHSEQVDYYSDYITSCLDNLTAKSKLTNRKAAEGKGRKKLCAVSYSAVQLHEKGVLLEIQDLPNTQFKNVIFDIIPGSETGSFVVKARFLGVEMEQFTLKYQYEGVAVMKMFDKAKVNVNLLIFLLNKKLLKK
ncbi:hypothetical protein fugu_009528 [Takifugu bimaculatus]|uniref:Ras-GAP domain-containing protein n=1 Tax=Takifugu bimaculatus TaxID=433685 RepID=A0A4Z2CD19_9TELE|nr:hypothetical protein fugu_009528 [Takifugu bimaculatus]